MSLLQTLRIALRALSRNKTRAFLTTLGIVIGVGAVIAMVAIGEGAKARVQSAFDAMGANLLIVMPGASSRGGIFGGFGSQPTLTWDDLKAIRTETSAVRAAAAVLRTNAQVISDEQNWSTSVYGTTRDYFVLRDWRPRLGELFSPSDLEGGTKVVVLGQTVCTKLFGPDVDPVGRYVRIRGVPFLVLGVLAPKGQSPMGQDFDDGVFVPEAAYQSRLQGGMQRYISGVIYVGARSADSSDAALQQITTLLRDRHHIRVGVDDDFSIRNLSEMASAMQDSTRTLTTLLAAIAAVSLLVGGIGIMNIMLVSVTERTREIGVRMAVGARPRDILAQFLVEALTLSVIGGLIGVGLGVLAARQLAATFGWSVLIRPDIVIIATSFSGLVGVVFGLYPARRASRLDPIDALRYE